MASGTAAGRSTPQSTACLPVAMCCTLGVASATRLNGASPHARTTRRLLPWLRRHLRAPRRAASMRPARQSLTPQLSPGTKSLLEAHPQQQQARPRRLSELHQGAVAALRWAVLQQQTTAARRQAARVLRAASAASSSKRSSVISSQHSCLLHRSPSSPRLLLDLPLGPAPAPDSRPAPPPCSPAAALTSRPAPLGPTTPKWSRVQMASCGP